LHTVYFATRIQNNSSTAIENIFVDNSGLKTSYTSPLINGLADHDAQFVTINNIYAATNKIPLKQRTRLINSDGCAMAQVVSRQPLTAEARVQSRVSPCEICGGQSGTGTGYSPSCQFSPVNFIPLVLHLL
jgi:hypothetical protein